MYKYYIISSTRYKGKEITECSSKDECEDKLSDKAIYGYDREGKELNIK